MSSSDDRELQIPSERLEWRWHEGHNTGDAVHAPGDGKLSISSANEGVVIRRTDAAGRITWTSRIHDADAGRIDADALAAYAALYRTRVTGARLRALDVATGDVLWEVALEGIGLIHHSKYETRIQIRLIDGSVVVYGAESGGRYIEVRATADGRLLGHRVLPPS
jgi:hypothetical protein